MVMMIATIMLKDKLYKKIDNVLKKVEINVLKLQFIFVS